jgi:hypothetical protein
VVCGRCNSEKGGGALWTSRARVSKIESASIRHSIGQYGPAQRESRVRFVAGCQSVEIRPPKVAARWLDDIPA